MKKLNRLGGEEHMASLLCRVIPPSSCASLLTKDEPETKPLMGHLQTVGRLGAKAKLCSLSLFCFLTSLSFIVMNSVCSVPITFYLTFKIIFWWNQCWQKVPVWQPGRRQSPLFINQAQQGPQRNKLPPIPSIWLSPDLEGLTLGSERGV